MAQRGSIILILRDLDKRKVKNKQYFWRLKYVTCRDNCPTFDLFLHFRTIKDVLNCQGKSLILKQKCPKLFKSEVKQFYQHFMKSFYANVPLPKHEHKM